MTDPATLPLLILLAVITAVLLTLAWWADRKTRIRPNRRRGMPAPRPDGRSSIDEFNRIMGRR